MKVANIINVVVQGLGILGTFSCLTFCYFDNLQDDFNNHLLENEAIISGIAFIFIYGYQIINAIVMSIIKLVRKEFNWLMGIYWLLGLVYISFWIFLFAGSMSDDEFFYGILMGWIPVLYYFAISIIDLKHSLMK
jgi:hypothetical protein